MTPLAVIAGLVTYLAVQIWVLIRSSNVRRFYAGLARLGLSAVMFAVPWVVTGLRPDLLQPLMYPRLLHWNQVVAVAVPAFFSLLLVWLVNQLQFSPRWNADPKDDTSPIAAIGLRPVAAALAACLVVLAVQGGLGWLLAEHWFGFLPVVDKLSSWGVIAP